MPKTTGEKGVSKDDPKTKKPVGRIGGQGCYKYHDRGAKTKIHSRTKTVSSSPPRRGNFRKNCLRTGRIHSKLAGYKCHKRDNYPYAPSFFHYLHETEEKREKTSDYRFVQIEPITGNSEVQNGDGSSYSGDNYRKSLGLFNRHKGCVLSCASKLGIPQISGLQGQEQDFRFSVPSLRAISSSLGFHKGDQTHKTTSPFTTNYNLQLHRRFHSICHIPELSNKISKHGVGITSEIRVQHKLGKIESGTITKGGISGGRMGFENANFVSPHSKEGSHISSVREDSEQGTPNAKGIRKSFGDVEFCVSLCPTGKVTSSSFIDLDESADFCLDKGSTGSSGFQVQRPSWNLDGSGIPESECDLEAGSSKLHPYDGCFFGRLVRDSTSSQGFGILEPRRSPSFHELEGVDGCISVTAEVQVSVEGEMCTGPVGQHDNSMLSEETRVSARSSTTFSIDGDSGILQAESNQSHAEPHQGGVECHGRPGFKGKSRRGGMVPGPDHVRVDRKEDSGSPNRPFCDQGKHSDSYIHFSVSGRSSGRLRRFQPGLERVDVHLPVPSCSSTLTSSCKASGVSGFGSTNSSSMDESGLVSFITDEVQDETFSSPSDTLSESMDFEGFDSHGTASLLESSRLATIRNGLDMGLTPDSLNILDQSHRQSTQRQYQAIWKKFLEFLAANSIPHDSVSLSVVMNFLSHHAISLNRQYRTIAAYKCALDIPLKAQFGLDLGGFELSLFMRGIFNKNPPQKAKPMPSWSLDDLLNFLKCEIF